jgi:hypothetical protein
VEEDDVVIDGPEGPTLLGSKSARRYAPGWIRALVRPVLPRAGVVNYTVDAETTLRVERRGEIRRPVHLQSGKILDVQERFLTEFLFKNRTEVGIRLRLAHRATLPRFIFLYDDQSCALAAASVVWQHGCDVGCRVSRKPLPSKEQLLKRLKSPYYAVQ